MKKIETLKKALKKKFPTIVFADDSWTTNGFAISAESDSTVHETVEGIDTDIPLADYYGYEEYDPEETLHEFGVNKTFADYLRREGYHAEWINPGVLGIYKT